MTTSKKTALITGASRGIGNALVKQFLSLNYTVIGTSRGGNIQDFNADFYNLKLDLSDGKSMMNASEFLKSNFQTIDVLINNAGVGPDLFSEKPEQESFQDTFNVNVTGTVFFTESIIPLIKKGGLILNISSKMGAIDVCQLHDSVAYRMSKSALNMYTKILSNRLKGEKRVISIHPGWVKTTIAGPEMNGRLTTDESAQGIMDFINSDYENVLFWDAETNEPLPW